MEPLSLLSGCCEWFAFSEGQLEFVRELTLSFPEGRNLRAFASCPVDPSISLFR